MTTAEYVPGRAVAYTANTDRLHPYAECAKCPWHRRDNGPGQWLAVRAAARRHVVSTGHDVLLLVTTSYLIRQGAQADEQIAP